MGTPAGEWVRSGPWDHRPPSHPQVFSLIVFSSLLTDGYQNKTNSSQLHCVLNSNRSACSFAVGAGLLAFLSCLAFLALDAHESRLASSRFKTAFQLLDFILASEPPHPTPGVTHPGLPPNPAPSLHPLPPLSGAPRLISDAGFLPSFFLQKASFFLLFTSPLEKPAVAGGRVQSMEPD